MQDEGGRRVVPNPLPPIRRANVVLSDMAPSFSGDRDTDQARVAGLVLDALAACLGDEASRRREPPKSAAGGTGKGSGGRSDGVAAGEEEGGDGVESQLLADRGVAIGGSCSPSNPQKGQEEVAGPWPVEETPASNIGETGGGSSNSSSSSHGRGSPTPLPEAVAAKSGREEEAPREGTGLLARGGTFLGKFFAGRDEREVKVEAERLFEKVRVVKPPASRSGSGEMYLLATGFLLGGRRKRQK